MPQPNAPANALPRDVKHLVKLFMTAIAAIAAPQRPAICKAALQKIQADLKAAPLENGLHTGD